MCDTMTNIPMEDSQTYVLTEDMIDAAMNEQFAFQDGTESEEEFDSQRGSKEVDLESEAIPIPESNTQSFNPVNDYQGRASADDFETLSPEKVSGNVIVIETGLDTSEERSLENNDFVKMANATLGEDQTQVATISLATDNLSKDSVVNTLVNSHNDSSEAVANNDPILKSILISAVDSEPIDLCNSDTDEFSENEVTEVELIDNELQSVMESNLMAETGMAVKIKDADSQFSKPPDVITTPKIKLKNISEISSCMLNDIPQNSLSREILNEELHESNKNSEVTSEAQGSKFKSFPGQSFEGKSKEKVPTLIHINKIAVPNQTFVNQQGQKMKCVYIKNPMSTPVVINSNQLPSANNKNVKFIMSPQTKKPIRLSPTEVLPNISKRQMYHSETVLPNKKINILNNLPFIGNNRPVLPVDQSLHQNHLSSMSNMANNLPVMTNNQPVSANNQSFHQSYQCNVSNNLPMMTNKRPALPTNQSLGQNYQSDLSNSLPMMTNNQPILPINPSFNQNSQYDLLQNPPVMTNKRSALPINQQYLQSNQPNTTNNLPAMKSNASVFPNNQCSVQNSHPSVSNHQPIPSYNQNSTQNFQRYSPKPNVLSFAPKLVKTPNPARGSIDVDEDFVSSINFLLFESMGEPYEPSALYRNMPTFSCADCKDRFIFQSSLTDHLARRSFQIRYRCQFCSVELHFFNRCVFLRHLRSHNLSQSQIDYSNISVTPLPMEMVKEGLVSTFFTDCFSNSVLPLEERILRNTDKDLFAHISSAKQSNSVICVEKSHPPVSNMSHTQQNAIASTSQARNFQSQTSLLVNNPMSSHFPYKNPSKKVSVVVPVSLPTNPPTPSVQGSKTFTKEPLSNTKIIKQKKKVVLLLDKFNKPLNIKQNTNINALPPNELISVSESTIVDDDTLEQENENIEAEDVDIESVTVEVDSQSNGSSNLISESGKHLTKEENQKKGVNLPSKPLKKTCTECGIKCLNIGRHLNGANRPTNPQLVCETCDLIFPTKCALKCHVRIHLKLPPYRCPDCGKDFTEQDELRSHLKLSCGHFAKCVRYMCLSCKAHFPAKSILGHHISKQHSRDIFRCSCSSCPVAYYSKPSLEKHMAAEHQGQSVISVCQKQCSLCPRRVVPLEEFPSHIQEHENSAAVLTYGYKCPMCSVVFANKMTFIIHQMKERENEENPEKKKKKNARPTPKYLSKDTEKIVPEQSHDLGSKFEEAECSVKFTEYVTSFEKDPLSLEDWEVSQEQRVNEKKEELCIVCKKNSVLLLPEIDLNEQSLCCKQCVKPLDVDSMMGSGRIKISNTQLLKNRHKFGRSFIIKDNTSNVTFTSKVQKKPFSGESDCIGPKKPRKSETYLDYVDPDKEANVPLPVKQWQKKPIRKKKDFAWQSHIKGQIILSKSSGELLCAKCKFVADTKETFQEHITVHRTDPNTYQCLECGLCFVVLPSLERHLQMHHEVKDVRDYIKQNKFSLPQKNEEESLFLEENQCRVCLEKFDSLSSLEKHFRTHGMAFMSSLSKSP